MNMSRKDPAQYARKLLDRLIELDKLTVGHYFEMGQLISAIEHGKLWELLGYKSIRHLIEEELSFSSGTGYRYLHTYRNSRRVGFTKTQTLNLLGEYGITRTSDYLAQAKRVESARAIKQRMEDLRRSRQINFTLTNEQHAKTLRVLTELGVERSESGRFVNSSEKFMEMVDMAAADLGINGGSKPKLKVVK